MDRAPRDAKTCKYCADLGSLKTGLRLLRSPNPSAVFQAAFKNKRRRSVHLCPTEIGNTAKNVGHECAPYTAFQAALMPSEKAA